MYSNNASLNWAVAAVVRSWWVLIIGCYGNAVAQQEATLVPQPPYRTISPAQGHMKDQCTLDLNGELYNLWPIARKDKPRWQSVPSKTPLQDSGLYTFDPCYPFNQDKCKNSLVCRRTEEFGSDTSIGLAGTALFGHNDAGQLTIQYKGIEEIGSTSNVTQVELICDREQNEPLLVVLGPSTPGIYSMRLTSRCCCPDGCLNASLSFGSILCILFICIVFIYFVGGMLYMKLIRGATGVEIIPHSAFWLDLPNLIVDGINFVFTCGKGVPNSQAPGEGPKSEYERI